MAEGEARAVVLSPARPSPQGPGSESLTGSPGTSLPCRQVLARTQKLWAGAGPCLYFLLYASPAHDQAEGRMTRRAVPKRVLRMLEGRKASESVIFPLSSRLGLNLEVGLCSSVSHQ